MNKRLGTILMWYGTFLVLCGVAGFLLTGETSSSSLFNGGVFGSLMIVVGLLLRQGRQWTMPAALSATAIFTLTFVWRGVVQWVGVAQGAGGSLGVALLLTLMFAVSAVVLGIMFKHYRH